MGVTEAIDHLSVVSNDPKLCRLSLFFSLIKSKNFAEKVERKF